MTTGRFINTPRGVFHYHSIGQAGTQIHFCHGNSLSAGTYLPFLTDLANHGFSIFASDIRGHGFSTKEQTATVENWQIFIRDLATLVTGITRPPVIGIGHSIGGYFTYAAAALYPHLFSRLVLLDPIVFPSGMLRLAALIRKLGLSGYMTLPKKTRAKKNEFASKKDALAHYRGKGMFKSWDQAFVNAYVDTAIEQDTKDSYSLCCHPEFEAQIYEQVPVDTWTHAPKIQVPVLVVRGKTSDLFYPSAGRKIKKNIRQCSFVELDHLGHFLMMENSSIVIDTMLPFLHGK